MLQRLSCTIPHDHQREGLPGGPELELHLLDTEGAEHDGHVGAPSSHQTPDAPKAPVRSAPTPAATCPDRVSGIHGATVRPSAACHGSKS